MIHGKDRSTSLDEEPHTSSKEPFLRGPLVVEGQQLPLGGHLLDGRVFFFLACLAPQGKFLDASVRFPVLQIGPDLSLFR